MPDAMTAPATYRLSTYDPGDSINDDWGWNLRRAGLTRWELREAIRWARDWGYDDDVSILVERETPTHA